jgi:hypothetical protein
MVAMSSFTALFYIGARHFGAAGTSPSATAAWTIESGTLTAPVPGPIAGGLPGLLLASGGPRRLVATPRRPKNAIAAIVD